MVSDELTEQYDEIINYTKLFEKYLNAKKVGKNNSIMRGGSREEILKKLEKINQMISIYDSIDLKKIDATRTKLSDGFNKVNEYITNASNTAELVESQEENKILNTMEILAQNIKQMAHGFEILPIRTKVYLPVNLDKLHVAENQKSIYINLVDKYKISMGEIRTQLGINIASGQILEQKFIDDINGKLEELTGYNAELEQLIENLKRLNTEFAKSIEFTESLDRDTIIMGKSDLIARIEASNNQKIIEFKNKYLGLYKNKKLKANRFISYYNETASKIKPENLATEGLPHVYFNGIYTSRVTNNLLISGAVAEPQLSLINSLIGPNDSSGLEVKVDTPMNFQTRINVISNPDFSSLLAQSGGSYTSKFTEFDSAVNKYALLLSEYNVELTNYNFAQSNKIMHTLFLTLIATNQIYIKNYTVYIYMNKYILDVYTMILDKIIAQMDKSSNLSQPILYMKKYHWVSIMKLSKFIKKLSSDMGPNDIIDITKTTGQTGENFLLLNYFKVILESYNETFQNKITIYSRINNIGYSRPIDTTNDVFKAMINNNRLMEINKTKCIGLAGQEQIQPIQFTQVFDTEKFPNNDDLAKYMTLDTQLAKGKSVGLMTYGYSGTGKTYTLFGSDGVSGLLQSTIDNVNGLLKLKFRCFEIYGMGVPFPHYWAGRADTIYNEIIHYNLEVSERTIRIITNNSTKSVKTIKAEKMAEYINEANDLSNTYIEVIGESITEVLQNFESFVNEVETYRKFTRKIRDTPNNVVSSRSVLVYDFALYVEDINKPPVKFLILDLPGREEIIKTYVSTYLSNPTITDILGLENQQSKIYHEFLFSVMCLNPLAVSLFEPEIVYDTISSKKYKADVWDSVIDQEFDYSNEQIEKLRKDNMMIQELKAKIDFIKLTPPNALKVAMGAATEGEIKKICEIIKIPRENYASRIVKIEDIVKIKNSIASSDITIKELDDFETKYIKNKEKTKIIGVRDGGQIRGFKYQEEFINMRGATIGKLLHYSGKQKGIEYPDSDYGKGFGLYGYASTQKDPLQKQALGVLGINLINRVILLNRYDILEEIYRKISDKHINNKISNFIDAKSEEELRALLTKLISENFKGDLKELMKNKDGFSSLKACYDNPGCNQLVNYKKQIKELMNWDYYLAAFEGIYINENIIGLIKYLDDKLVVEKTKESTIERQNANLNFSYQQKMARMWLISSDGEEYTKHLIGANYQINPLDVPNKLFKTNEAGDGIKFDYGALEREYEKFKQVYKSDKIFNYAKPLISTTMEPYVKQIDDYKVFYLFANYANKEMNELKCGNQYNLLQTTRNFIDTIAQ